MPGLQLQTTALLLARQPGASDTFEQWSAFSGEHGVLLCLGRLARPAASRRGAGAGEARLDLFDEAELWLESSSQGRTWFLKEHRLVRRHDGIGRSYAALRAASALSALVLRNPVPEESRVPVAALLAQTLASLAAGGRPDVVWFKALFCFLRDEGYPVKQQWWPQLSAPDRDLAALVLNQPTAGQDHAPDAVAALVRRLEDWLGANTEIRLR